MPCSENCRHILVSVARGSIMGEVAGNEEREVCQGWRMIAVLYRKELDLLQDNDQEHFYILVGPFSCSIEKFLVESKQGSRRQ